MSGYLKRCVKFTPKCGSGNVLRIVKGARVNILQRRHSRNLKTQSTILSLSLSLSLTSETSGTKIRQNYTGRNERKLSLIYERAEESFRQEPTCFRSFLAC